jgi:hypothetical protein
MMLQALTKLYVLISGADAAGRPSISAGGCSCSVGLVSISIHGSLKFVLDLFKSTIEHKIRDAIPGKLCSGVTNAINTGAEKSLQKLKGEFMNSADDMIWYAPI